MISTVSVRFTVLFYAYVVKCRKYSKGITQMEYTLKYGEMSAICCDMGAELISFRDENGKEYIWCGDPDIWGRHAPILFPVVARTINDSILIDGKEYEMGIHGFANKSLFSVVAQSENEIVFELTENKETLKKYPFRFSLKITHRLESRGFITSFEVANIGEKVMPFCIGAHPGFNCEGDFTKWRVVFEKCEDAWAYILDDRKCLSEKNKEHTLNGTDTIYLDHGIFDRVDTLHFKELKSESVKLLNEDGKGIKVDFSGFPMLGLWTAVNKNAPYLCIEPWHGCGAFEDETGELSDKPYCIMLEPGEYKKLSYKVTVI